MVQVASACAKDWEVIVSARGEEVDAKSILALLLLAAAYDSEIEILSLMPAEDWGRFTLSLESLFFITDHEGSKANAYAPVERVLQFASNRGRPSCLLLQEELRVWSSKYNCAPFFERIDDQSLGAIKKNTIERAPFDFDKIDTFISYDSADFSFAVSIYDALVARGLNVFFAGASLPRTGTTDFQLAIEKALASTRSMVLITTEPGHLEGGWVRAEWTTFLNEKRAGRKTGNLVTVRPKKLSVARLPVLLRMFHSEGVTEYGGTSEGQIERLIQFLNIGDDK